MAFAKSIGQDNHQPLTEINMVPLIDVMLVLLIVFMVTAPLLTNSVHVDLPKASSSAEIAKPEHIDLALHADGAIWWQGQPVDSTELGQRLHAAGQQEPLPELRLRADAGTRYEAVAQLMARATREGITRIGFVSQPDAP
ncbi:MAG: biopolymer transporter ExbD [Azonexus sp.]